MKAFRMEHAHVSAVADIERRVFSEAWSEASLALLLSDAAIGAVCLDGDRAVAYGGMLWGVDEGQITNIAVLPEYRRCGMGAAVLAFLIDEAEKRGCLQISLEVRASNRAAIALYERFGFVIAGQRRRFYKNPIEDAYVMLLDLNFSKKEN